MLRVAYIFWACSLPTGVMKRLNARGKNMLKINRLESLKNQTYDAILQAIMDGDFKQGKIYSAQFFADHFKVSRTPVREAMLRLRDDGLIRVIPNRGVEINPLTEQSAKDIFRARIAIEGYCAMYLAKNKDTLAGRETIKRMSKIASATKLTKEDDLEFHFEIIKFCKNPIFEEEFISMRAKVQIFWDSLIMKGEHREEEVRKEHLKILKKIKEGDGKGAFRAVEEHMEVSIFAFLHGNG